MRAFQKSKHGKNTKKWIYQNEMNRTLNVNIDTKVTNIEKKISSSTGKKVWEVQILGFPKSASMYKQ
jgi:hypothetical protein